MITFIFYLALRKDLRWRLLITAIRRSLLRHRRSSNYPLNRHSPSLSENYLRLPTRRMRTPTLVGRGRMSNTAMAYFKKPLITYLVVTAFYLVLRSLWRLIRARSLFLWRKQRWYICIFSPSRGITLLFASSLAGKGVLRVENARKRRSQVAKPWLLPTLLRAGRRMVVVGSIFGTTVALLLSVPVGRRIVLVGVMRVKMGLRLSKGGLRIL